MFFKKIFVLLFLFLFSGAVFAAEGSTPRVKYAWDWPSVSQNFCDASNSAYVYCDATQFTIMLMKKISSLEENPAGSSLVFNAHLIADGYPDDFRKDFDYYSKSLFFEASEYYSNPATGFWKYFVRGNLFEFQKNGEPWIRGMAVGPGLHRITVSFPADFDLVNPGETPVIVNIVSEQPPSEPSILYEIPLDGLVGFQGVEGEDLNRIGYGSSYAGSSAPVSRLKINDATTLDFSLLSSSDSFAKLSDIVILNSFENLNDSRRGELLRVTKNGTKYLIEYSSSVPTPLLLEVNKTGSVETFSVNYRLLDGGSSFVFSEQPDSLVRWTSSSEACLDFDGEVMAEKYGGAILDSFNPQASASFGVYSLEWGNASASGRVVLDTVVFSPKNGLNLRLVSGTSDGVSTSLYNGVISGQTIALSGMNDVVADNASKSLDSFFALEAQGLVSFVQSGNSLMVKWSEPAVKEMVSARMQSLNDSCIVNPDAPIVPDPIVPGPSGAPTSLIATPISPRAVNLVWGGVQGTLNYNIYMNIYSGEQASRLIKGFSPAPQVSFAVTGLNPETDPGLHAQKGYCFVVTAIPSSGDESGASNEACVTKAQFAALMPVPEIPDGNTAAGGMTVITLDDIKKFFGNVWDSIKEFISHPISSIINWWNDFTTWWGKLDWWEKALVVAGVIAAIQLLRKARGKRSVGKPKGLVGIWEGWFPTQPVTPPVNPGYPPGSGYLPPGYP